MRIPALRFGGGLAAVAIGCVGCDPNDSTSSIAIDAGRLNADHAPMHAMVHLPEGTSSSLVEPEGDAIRLLPPDEAGGDDWYLVFMSPAELRDLARREGVAWRELPPEVRLRVPNQLTAISNPRTIDRGAGPVTVCDAVPESFHWCPYLTNRSATIMASPGGAGHECEQSIYDELDSVDLTYPNVTIGGSSQVYVHRESLGTTATWEDGDGNARAPIEVLGVRVGDVDGTDVPQLVIYAAQHAREWVTTEMTMRLLRHFASGYRDGDPAIRALLSDRVLMFVPVVNATGYELSHEAPGQRLWRPNRVRCGAG